MTWNGHIPQNRADKRTRRLSQMLSRPDLSLASNFIPYSGAVSNVNLGSQTFTTTGDISSPKGTGTIWGNEAFGRNSLLSVTTGDFNTAIGSRALEAITVGHSNTAIGRKAGVSLTEGDYNVAIGLQALQNATTANQNVAIGTNALLAVTTGASNFACGYYAVDSLTEGVHNVGLGSEVLTTITTQNYNTAIGSYALGAITASECTAIGYQAGKTCGAYSISIGPFAGYVIGTNSVSIGSRAGFTTVLNNNIFIGHEAGKLNEGAGNIFLGYQAGYNELGSNKLYIQNSNSATPLIHGDFSTPSLTINGLFTVGKSGVATDYDVNFYGHYDATYDYQFHWDAINSTVWFGRANNSVGGLFNLVIGDGNTLLLNRNIVIGYAHNVNGNYNAAFGRGHPITSNYALVGGYVNTINNQYAFAAGRNNTVSYCAGAIGRENTASGSYSFSVGYSNSSTGIEAMSFGLGNTAGHTVAIMIGNGNTSTGNYAYCIGNGNSSGYNAAAIGYYNVASANFSITLGRSCVSNAESAISIGYTATASGVSATAIGGSVTASGQNAVVIGNSVTNSTANSVLFGSTNSLFFGTTTSIRLNDDGVDIDVVIEGDTDIDLFHSDASTDRIGISTATPAATLDVLGTTRLGNSATNYTQFAANGSLTLTGTARVTNLIWMPAGGIKAPGVKPATWVDHGISGAWEFSDATDDTLVTDLRVPNRMDRTVSPTINIDWSAAGISPGNCEWQLEYIWRTIDESTIAVAQETLTVITAASSTANGLNTSTFTGVDLPSATDRLLQVRIKRLAAGANDTIADTVELHAIYMEFTTCRLGKIT